MTSHTRHPLAADYLERLERAAARVPGDRRTELVAEIVGHLSEAIGPHDSDAEALTVLDRLGTPEEIVDAEAPPPAPVAAARGIREWAAIVLLLFGGLVAGIGWLVGLILLWASPAWTTWDKWIGTLGEAWSCRCWRSPSWACRPARSASTRRESPRSARVARAPASRSSGSPSWAFSSSRPSPRRFIWPAALGGP